MASQRAASTAAGETPRASFPPDLASGYQVVAANAAHPHSPPHSPPHSLAASPCNTQTAATTEDYLASKVITPKGNWAGDESLARSRKRALEAGVPPIAVSPLQGQFLSILTKSIGATKVLEIGTLWGYSTVFFTRALPPSGQIDTLEIDPLHAKVANETFLDADLFPFPKVHLGPALDTLETLTPPGQVEGLADAGYDLVFIDANKDQIKEYFDQALRLTRKGALIVVDNAIRNGRIVPSDKEESDYEHDQVSGLRKLLDWLEQDAGKTVLATGLQTVGAKSWDGYIIATKL